MENLSVIDHLGPIVTEVIVWLPGSSLEIEVWLPTSLTHWLPGLAVVEKGLVPGSLLQVQVRVLFL